MPTVSLTINGRNYSIACDDGQERRVMELGHFVDKRLREIARGAGAVSEQHLMVLTSILMADELFELREQAETAEQAPASFPQAAANDEQNAEREAHMADMISTLAKKIEAVSTQLATAANG